MKTRRGLNSPITLSCCSGDGGRLECLNFLSKCERALSPRTDAVPRPLQSRMGGGLHPSSCWTSDSCLLQWKDWRRSRRRQRRRTQAGGPNMTRVSLRLDMVWIKADSCIVLDFLMGCGSDSVARDSCQSALSPGPQVEMRPWLFLHCWPFCFSFLPAAT